MRKLLIITMLLITGCTDMKTESEENSVQTIYRYGTLVKIKNGFYREFQCGLIAEYADSVFCKIIVAPDGTLLNDKWQTNQNFKKSNIELPKE
jgi:hypothetical protein